MGMFSINGSSLQLCSDGACSNGLGGGRGGVCSAAEGVEDEKKGVGAERVDGREDSQGNQTNGGEFTKDLPASLHPDKTFCEYIHNVL